MIKNKQSLGFFLGTLILSFFLLICGLKIYFNNDKLSSQLSYTIYPDTLSTSTGKSQHIHHQTYWGKRGEPSAINASGLGVLANWYKTLQIKFAQKDPLQSFTLTVTGSDKDKPVKQIFPILYTDNQIATINLSKLRQYQSLIINEISLSTNKLIGEPYAIQSITFNAKDISWYDFCMLVALNFTQIPNIFNLNSQRNTIMLLPFSLLLLLYTAVFLVTALMAQLRKKQQFVFLTVSFFSATWLILDAMFMSEIISKINFEELINKYLSINGHQYFFCLTLILIWILGSSLIANCFKKRYGYLALNIGVGFWFSLTLLMILADYSPPLWVSSIGLFSLPSHILITVLSLAFVGVIGCFIYRFLPSRLCSIEEHRLEKAPPNYHYLVVAFLILATLFHLLIIVYLNFQHDQTKPESYLSNIALLFNIDEMVAKNVVYVLSIISLLLVFYGGLRYLGFSILLSWVVIYLFSSIPLWASDWHLFIFSYFVGSFTLFLACLLRYKEYRLILCLMLLLATFFFGLESLLFSGDFTPEKLGISTLSLIDLKEGSLFYTPYFSVFYPIFLLGMGFFFIAKSASRKDEQKGAAILIILSLILFFCLWGGGLIFDLLSVKQIESLTSIGLFLLWVVPVGFLHCLINQEKYSIL